MDTELSGSVGDIFLQKFSSIYEPQWGGVIGGTGVEAGFAPYARVDNWQSPDGIGYTPVVFSSSSIDLPTQDITPGSDIYKSVNSGGSDGAIAIFDPYGVLYFSSYIGGDGSDDMEDIKETIDNGLIIVGYSSSEGGALKLKDFNTGSSEDIYYSGTRLGYILELDQSLNAVWATKFGSSGTAYERVTSITLDNNSDFVISGITSSSGLPTTTGAFQTGYGGNQDAFVAKVNHETKEIIWCTYFGGSNGLEVVYSTVVDNENNVYSVGMYRRVVNIADFPLLDAGEYFDDVYNASLSIDNEGIIFRLDEDGDLTWSTYFGGDGYDWIYDVATDGRLIAITGSVRNENEVFSLVNYTDMYFDDVINVLDETKESTAYVSVFDRSTELLWSTFLGDKATSIGRGLSFDPATDLERRLFVGGGIGYNNDDYLTFEPLCDPGFDGYYQDVPIGYIPGHPYANSDGFILGFDIEGFPKDPPLETQSLQSSELFVYPNPTESLIYLSDENELMNYYIYSIHGELVLNGLSINNIIEMSALQNGIYILEVEVNESIHIYKIIKQ